MIAKRVCFTGYVQGVGFRYTARNLAQSCRVTGYVMNLPDGQVEMHVEGHEQDVDAMIDSVRKEMNAYIRDIQIEQVTPRKKYNQFVVRYYQ